MEDPHTTHRFVWEGIEIEAKYTPLQWNVIAHLEIESVKPPRAPLPISETGYKSWYHQPNTIEASGMTVEEFVRAELTEAAASPEWKTHLESTRQGSLF